MVPAGRSPQKAPSIAVAIYDQRGRYLSANGGWDRAGWSQDARQIAHEVPIRAILIPQMNRTPPSTSHCQKARGCVLSKNERVILELQILKYRQLARQMAAVPDEAKRITELIADLERKLREIDE